MTDIIWVSYALLSISIANKLQQCNLLFEACGHVRAHTVAAEVWARRAHRKNKIGHAVPKRAPWKRTLLLSLSPVSPLLPDFPSMILGLCPPLKCATSNNSNHRMIGQ